MAGEASRNVLKIALLGNHSPRRCGIATFTADFAAALRGVSPDIAVDIYAMNDPGAAYDYPPQVVHQIEEANPIAYSDAARTITASGADLLWIQHEYGIFGGSAGSHLLRLLDRISIPVIVTLHTILTNPNEDQRRVLEAIARRASRLVVMAERGRRILIDVHGIAADKILVIPHGIVDRPLLDTEPFKERFGLGGHKTIFTFGLLSPNKGIETMIRAMPRIVTAQPDVLYTVLGATHPHLVAHEGEKYREQLIALARELGVERQVRFVDTFVELDDLLDHLAAADLYVTSYLNPAQITSGTLSYAVGMGKPVVSTPYWHAEELLADGVGALVAFDDPEGFARRIIELLRDDRARNEMRARAYARGRSMTWASVAGKALSVARAVVAEAPVRLPARPAQLDIEPQPSLIAVRRMSDSCGIFQHSIFSVPDRTHGYCLDDNARALILAHRAIEEGSVEPEEMDGLDCLIATYCSFIQDAWNSDVGRFRNFMSYKREWLEDIGSDDSFGRGLWAIGVTAAEAHRHDIRSWALHLFEQVASRAIELDASRAAAFNILGADALLETHPGNASAMNLVETLSRRLLARLRSARQPGWTWFEDVLAYDNARLPEALLRAGRRLDHAGMVEEGLRALEWLDAMQTAEEGHFRAVGTESFGRPHSPPLPFDQQPLEAWATIEAAEVAYAVSGNERWLRATRHAFAWYLGRNDLGLHMATLQDGGCYDGLMPDRANLNQGAESVLAFQLAQCAMLRVARMQARSGMDVFAAAE